MVTGATSLGLVRDELFATMEEAEQSLEHFIIDRNNGGLLQQAVETPEWIEYLETNSLSGSYIWGEEFGDYLETTSAVYEAILREVGAIN